MSIFSIINALAARMAFRIHPVGTILTFAGSTIPDGYLLCDGQAVSRTDYAKLFAAIGTIYGTGDGSTTFNLPNLINRFVQGSATAGTVKAAGLPNITGKIKDIRIVNSSLTENQYAEGCFTHTTAENAGAYSGTGKVQIDLGFNASRSNSIYGNSTTVQPPALTMKMIIKY